MIAGMIVAETAAGRRTFTQAPALFATAQNSADKRSSSIATKQSAVL